MVDGKSPNPRDCQGVLATSNGLPLVICDMPKFIRNVREGEWSR